MILLLWISDKLQVICETECSFLDDNSSIIQLNSIKALIVVHVLEYGEHGGGSLKLLISTSESIEDQQKRWYLLYRRKNEGKHLGLSEI